MRNLGFGTAKRGCFTGQLDSWMIAPLAQPIASCKPCQKHHLEKEWCEEYIRLLLMIIMPGAVRITREKIPRNGRICGTLLHKQRLCVPECLKASWRCDWTNLAWAWVLVSIGLDWWYHDEFEGAQTTHNMSGGRVDWDYDPMSCTSFRGSLGSRRLVWIWEPPEKATETNHVVHGKLVLDDLHFLEWHHATRSRFRRSKLG